jgi:hypothetical protein
VLKKYVDKTNESLQPESIISQWGGRGNPNVDVGDQSKRLIKGYGKKTSWELTKKRYRYKRNSWGNSLVKVENIIAENHSQRKDATGPPSGYPISLQLAGTDYDQMLFRNR